MKSRLIYSEEAARASNLHQPVVALESAVITHGLPRPANIELAVSLEEEIRKQGAAPATIALLDGQIHIGLERAELERLANEPVTRKISRRDFAIAMQGRMCGGTTVAGTLIAASMAGINVFATGGIGGVHRDAPTDVSADLPELQRRKLVVVCAGAKAILDLPATREYLETAGVPVIGYQTDEFPAFYSRHSGLDVDFRADDPQQIAQIALKQWDIGIESAILVVNPPPEDTALPSERIEQVIQLALIEAKQKHIRGAEVTPFLLERVSQLSGGDSLSANLALLRNNARLAARISVEINRLQYPGAMI
ncbi:MAG TPA: pseudouridine-5'-phosphate glycosidase [Anaerolineaceae bacterium]